MRVKTLAAAEAVIAQQHAALVELIEHDPHDLNDRRPCASCAEAKRAIARGREWQSGCACACHAEPQR